ncbi:MAG: ROK family protein [Bacteroidota bacterium]
MENLALGIDIGGTKTAFGLVNKQGEIICEESTTTNDFAEPRDLALHILNYVSKNINLDLLCGIGIGAPNGNQFLGTIEFAPNLVWKGIVPLVQIFEEVFQKKTFLTNDANAAAIGEKLFGNAKDLTDFVMITLGTGIGSGIICDGKLLKGKHALAGEYGHVRVAHNGRLCGCGRNGCLETYASSTGVVRSIKELDSVNKSKSVLIDLAKPSAKDVFDSAEKGDVFAQEIVDFTAETLGSALADFATFSDPEAYVLFGGLSKSGDEFTNKVKIAMEANILNIYKNKIELRTSELNNLNAAVLGSSAIVFSELNEILLNN